jgi:shikimate dehydrogenase
MINGNTEIVAHIGFPTHAFKAPMIYNPWFEKAGVNAIVVPMGCQAQDYPDLLRSVFKLANIRGALITMPHKVTTVGLLDEVFPTAAIAGSCNAVRRAQMVVCRAICLTAKALYAVCAARVANWKAPVF